MSRSVAAVCILWIAGYVAGFMFPLPWLSLYTALACGLAAIAVWTANVPGRVWLCALLLVAAGAAYYADGEHGNVSSLPGDMAEQEIRLHGTVVSVVDVDGDKASFVVKGVVSPVSAAEEEQVWESGLAAQQRKEERFQANVRLLERQERDIAAEWQRGDRIELTGTLRLPPEARNFGGFDYRSYLHRQHIHWLIQVKGAEQVITASPERFGALQLLRWNDRFRDFLGSSVERVFPGEQAGFMKGMLIGMTDDMDPGQFRQFSRLGLTHILAISGLNVAIFVACAMWLLRRLGCTRETCLLVCMALLPFYIAMTGASPSIVRAGLMGMIALYAAYRHMLKDGLQSVMLVGLLMLVWEPYYLFDVSFQLSFLVTIGLIALVPSMNRLLPVRYTALRDALSITFVSQLVSFPVSIYYFNQLSLLSLLANLCLVPVFSLAVMPAGTVAMLVGIVWPWGGRQLGWLVSQLNDLVFWLVAKTGEWDMFQTVWPTPGLLWMALYYGALAVAMKSLLRAVSRPDENAPPFLQAQQAAGRSRVWLAPAVALAALALLLWQGYDPKRWDRAGEVDFLDVGQGDSMLVRTPGRVYMLIDGGGTAVFRKPGEEWKERHDPYEVGRKLVVPLLKQRGVHKLDYVVMTHEDNDHCGGLQAVLEEMPVGALLFNGTLKPAPSVEKLFRTALEKQVRLVSVHAGQKLQLDAGTALHFLSPPPQEQPLSVQKEQNGRSVVFRMEMAGTNWLFTGDMDAKAEQDVLQAMAADAGVEGSGGGRPAVDVLKVAHHGSKTSTTEEWLDRWKPRTAVISVGQRNVYGHPSPLVVNRLLDRQTEIYRTDRHGEVQMRVSDGGISYRTKLSEP